MRLEFEAAAAEAYTAITDVGLLDKIDPVLDELEKDPGQAKLRQYRWSDPPLWGIRVWDYLLLWALEERDGESVVVVYYVGPDVYAAYSDSPTNASHSPA